jgi:hypothetical protein
LQHKYFKGVIKNTSKPFLDWLRQVKEANSRERSEAEKEASSPDDTVSQHHHSKDPLSLPWQYSQDDMPPNPDATVFSSGSDTLPSAWIMEEEPVQVETPSVNTTVASRSGASSAEQTLRQKQDQKPCSISASQKSQETRTDVEETMLDSTIKTMTMTTITPRQNEVHEVMEFWGSGAASMSSLSGFETIKGRQDDAKGEEKDRDLLLNIENLLGSATREDLEGWVYDGIGKQPIMVNEPHVDAAIRGSCDRLRGVLSNMRRILVMYCRDMQ